MTQPGLDICYISQKLEHKTNQTNTPKYNSLDKKKALLLLTQYNISYQGIQQRAQGERKKAIAISEKDIKFVILF